MMRNVSILSFFLLWAVSVMSYGQATNDYRSNTTSGNWSLPASWQRFNGTTWVAATVSPTNSNANVITILNGHSITVATSVTVDQTTIQSTGSITVNGNRTLTVTNGVGDDLTVDGLLTVNGVLSVNNSSATVVVNGTLTSNGDISISAGTLTKTSTTTLDLGGNLTNDGSFIDAAGTVNITGLTTIDGTGTTNFNNVTVATGAIGSVEGTVFLGGILTLQGTGTFDADGSGAGVFTIVSSSQSTGGSIATLPTPGNFTGNVTVQRYINSPEDWRYLSFPVSGANVGMLQDNIQVTGNFSDPSSGGNVLNSASPSIYFFNAPTQAWTAVGAGGSVASTSLSATTGYSIWSYLSADAVIDVTGAIGNGAVPLSLSTGDNLIPNPYPSPIDWSNVSFTGANLVTNAVYVRTALNTYVTFISGGPSTFGGTLALGQSFWVIASGGGGTLTFNETDKTSSATFIRKETPSDYLSIKLKKGNLTDEVFVHFRENATLGTDVQYDAIKKINEANFNLSSYNTNPAVDYAINAVPFLNCEYTTNLKLGATNPVGAYTLSFADLSTLSHGYNVVLVDKFLNVEMPITEDLSYPFSITVDPASKGDNRFKLAFKSSLVAPAIMVSGTLLSVPDGLGIYQWYKNDNLIAGATSNTFKVEESGVYSVGLSAKDCQVNSANVTVEITGLDDAASKHGYSAFPNPIIGDEFTLHGPNLDKARIHVYDYLGKELTLPSRMEETSTGIKTYTGDLRGYGEGFYLVKIINGVDLVQLKLIKY